MALFKKKTEDESKKKEKNLKKSGKTNKKSRKEIQNELKRARTIQNAIDYYMMYKNGVCALNELDTYSSCLKFTDINYRIATNEDQKKILKKYMELLNSLGNENNLQLLIHNKMIDEEEFEKSALIEEKNDIYSEGRNEWNEILRDKLKKGNNRITTEKYFVYNVANEGSYEKAKKAIEQYDTEYTQKLKDIGCKAEKVDGLERIRLMYSIMFPKEKCFFDYGTMDGNTTKDAIAPAQLDFDTDHFIIDGQWARVLFMKDYSTELPDDMIDKICSLETNLTIAFNMKAIPRGEDIQLVKNNLSNMEQEIYNAQRKAAKDGYDSELGLPLDLRLAQSEAISELEDVQERNQRLFRCQFLILLVTETKEKLEELTKSIKTIAKSRVAQIDILRMQQEEGFNACLPIGVRVKKRNRTLTTSAAGIFVPFMSQELMDKKESIYYGLNVLTKNIIMCNRLQLPNPSAWYFGTPGSGKSMAIKREIAQVLYKFTNDDLIVIDPENEYRYLASRLGGTIVNIDNKSGNHVNALAGDINAEDFLVSKVDFCQTFTAQIFCKELEAEEKSLVDRAVRSMYSKYSLELQNATDKVPEMPTLKTFYNELLLQEDEISRRLAIGIEMYVNGSYDLFSGQSTVDMENRFTVYNIRDTETTIKAVAMLVILEAVWDKIVYNADRGVRTWVWIDEIYILFKYEFAAIFLFELYKRARKYGAVISSCTQNVSDLLTSPTATSMLSNSSFIYMLAQAQDDRISLGEILHISNEQLSYVSNPPKGSGLLYNGNNIIIPFEDAIPKNTKTYEMMTSDFDERKAIREGKFNR